VVSPKLSPIPHYKHKILFLHIYSSLFIYFSPNKKYR
jgi:hypothetical protein